VSRRSISITLGRAEVDRAASRWRTQGHRGRGRGGRLPGEAAGGGVLTGDVCAREGDRRRRRRRRRGEESDAHTGRRDPRGKMTLHGQPGGRARKREREGGGREGGGEREGEEGRGLAGIMARGGSARDELATHPVCMCRTLFALRHRARRWPAFESAVYRFCNDTMHNKTFAASQVGSYNRPKERERERTTLTRERPTL